ncbi:MAG TPA: hypothetical protein VLK22_04000 [Candidatus Udaeobacter sp.]|nr:hypothetical protein [Candidatus Udaeobacter sp.]
MTNDIKKIIGTKAVKISLTIFAALIVIIIIFWFGMLVGFRKASFSYQWGKNYRNLFEAKSEHKFSRELRGRGFFDAHSAVGSVIKVDTSTLIIKGDDNIEKNIFISDRTVIRRGQDSVMFNDLKADDRVVVLGVPSSTGQIEARLIRVISKP